MLLAQFDISQRVWKIACGWTHTIVVMEEKTAYSCGFNDYGQLGRISNEMSIGEFFILSLYFILKI